MPKIWTKKFKKILPWSLGQNFTVLFVHVFGHCDDFIFLFWNFLTFTLVKSVMHKFRRRQCNVLSHLRFIGLMMLKTLQICIFLNTNTFQPLYFWCYSMPKKISSTLTPARSSDQSQSLVLLWPRHSAAHLHRLLASFLDLFVHISKRIRAPFHHYYFLYPKSSFLKNAWTSLWQHCARVYSYLPQ